jgi:hypothetical protein
MICYGVDFPRSDGRFWLRPPVGLPGTLAGAREEIGTARETLVAVSKYIHRGDEFAIRSPS